MQPRPIAVTVSFILVTFLCGCGSQKRKAGLSELRSVQSDVHELDIVVGAGTSQLEFGRRLTDSLLKIGDLQQSHSRVLEDFPKRDRETINEVYQHFSQALEAYRESKDFFGDTHERDLDPFEGDNMFGEQRYATLRSEFPNLDELPVAVDYSEVPSTTGGGGEKQFWKGDMLQALWKVASQEDAAAEKLVDQLEQK